MCVLKRLRFLLGAVLLFAGVQNVAAAVISGVTIHDFSSEAGLGHEADYLIDSTDFDGTYHEDWGRVVEGFWTAEKDELAPWVVFDLAESRNVVEIGVWNYNVLGGGVQLGAGGYVWENYLDRGAKNIDVTASADGTTFTSVGPISNLLRAPGADLYEGAHFSFDFEARYVKLTIEENWGSSWYTGLSQVQFYSAVVPEPSAFLVWSLLCMFGVGVAWWRRR